MGEHRRVFEVGRRSLNRERYSAWLMKSKSSALGRGLLNKFFPIRRPRN